MRLTDRVAVITGGGSGIGRATARAMAAAGASIAVCDIDGDNAESVAREIESEGGRARAYGLDVSDRDAVFTAFEDAKKDLGGIHIVVNNAGVTRPSMIPKISADDWRAVYSVNVDGVFYGIQAAASAMIDQQYGRIINTTSGAGLLGDIGQLHYSSSKGAVVAMTKSAARELAKHKITVNAISPAAITPMTKATFEDPKWGEVYKKMIPLGRMAEPEEIAAAYVFLASDDAAYITGVILRVDGGRAIGV